MRHFILATTAATTLFMAAAPAQAELTLHFPEKGTIPGSEQKPRELAKTAIGQAGSPIVITGGFVDTGELNFTDGKSFLIAKDYQNKTWIGFKGKQLQALTGRYYVFDSKYPDITWYATGYTNTQIAQAVKVGQVRTSGDLVAWLQDNDAARLRMQALIDAERKK